jgi:anti-sigma B factor antagonist
LACSFVSVTGYADCAVLALSGELDISDAAELSAQLTAVMSGEPWVIVDLADLAFIDCSSLRVLAGARERTRLAGGDVLLAGPRGAVTRLLLLTLWGREFSVFPSVSLAGFSAGLAKLSSKLAASRAGGSVAAAVDGTVTEAGSPAAVTIGRGRSSGRQDYWGAA